MAGVFAGLAWLTKASALFLVIGYALSFILSRYQRSKSVSVDRAPSLRNEHKYFVFVLAFAITALPLLARNTRIFGNPFYSFNTRYLFSDHFDHEQQDVSVKVAFAEYLRTHSFRDIALRASRGLFWQSFVLARSFGPIGFDSERVAVGWVALTRCRLGDLATRYYNHAIIGIAIHMRDFCDVLRMVSTIASETDSCHHLSRC